MPMEPGILRSGATGAAPMIEPETGEQQASSYSPAEVRGLTDETLAYMSLEEMLSELLERIRDELGADTAAVLLLDPDRNALVARAARGIEEEVRHGVRVPVGRGFAGRVAAERRPIAIEDLDHAHVVNPILRRKGIRSLLGVPLMVEDRAIGVLHVGTLHKRRFDENDARLLQLAADRVALAISRAELSEQRAFTEVMQRALLPDDLPAVPGLRLTAKYLPAQTGLKLGGDWYDVFTLPDGRVAFVIGDVVGRGIAAAVVMAEIRSALRAYAVDGNEPVQTVMRLDTLVGNLGLGRSATVAMFALDIEREELSGVSAGHPPALLMHPDGSSEFVVYASGPPLGFGVAGGYRQQQVHFPSGSALLLYTDGLVERRDAPIQEGLDRLAATAGRQTFSAAPTPEEARGEAMRGLADRIFEQVASETPLEDDVALLAIETLAIGTHLRMSLDASPRVLAGFRRALSHWLGHHGVEGVLRTDIVLACSEAAANAIEHAYGPVDARFDVECVLESEELRVEITDHGSWRPPSRRERGRGILIMRGVMDSAEIHQGDDGTTVTLLKRIGDER